MDRAFTPVRLSNGETVVTIASISEAGSFLLANLPRKRKRPKSYADAMTACIRGIGGAAEPETVRAAFLLALQDLAARPRK